MSGSEYGKVTSLCYCQFWMIKCVSLNNHMTCWVSTIKKLLESHQTLLNVMCEARDEVTMQVSKAGDETTMHDYFQVKFAQSI